MSHSSNSNRAAPDGAASGGLCEFAALSTTAQHIALRSAYVRVASQAIGRDAAYGAAIADALRQIEAVGHGLGFDCTKPRG